MGVLSCIYRYLPIWKSENMRVRLLGMISSVGVKWWDWKYPVKLRLDTTFSKTNKCLTNYWEKLYSAVWHRVYTVSEVRRLDEFSDSELLGHSFYSQGTLVKEVTDFRLFFWGLIHCSDLLEKDTSRWLSPSVSLHSNGSVGDYT